MKEELEKLERIYNRQHYFIDRHDGMAEKFINVLLVEITGLAIFFSLNINGEEPLKCFHMAGLALFLISFAISLTSLICIVRPLSSKAKKETDISIIKASDKEWIDKSILYYRGISAIAENANNNGNAPVEEYSKKLEDDSMQRDYIQQILILAQYSNYKRKKLEKSLVWVIITTFIGVLCALLLMIV